MASPARMTHRHRLRTLAARTHGSTLPWARPAHRCHRPCRTAIGQVADVPRTHDGSRLIRNGPISRMERTA